MAYKAKKKQILLLFIVLLALLVLTVTVVMAAESSGADAIARVMEGGGSPVYGTFENNISPWGIDAENWWWWT